MNHIITDYTYLQNTIWHLKAKFPFLRVKTIGKSVVGRSIYALEIGRENTPTVVLAGTLWGTDHLSGRSLLQFVEAFLQALCSKRHICGVDPVAVLRNRKIAVIPFVNPDGREICARGAHCGGIDSGKIRRLCGGNTKTWDANARGVEIPRNFDYRFEERQKREQNRGIYGPAPKGFGGSSPACEPETKAIADYCVSQTLLHGCALYPGKGEVFWRNAKDDPQKSEPVARLLALTAGYDLEADVGSIVDTGFKNYLNNQTGRPAFDVMIPHMESERFFREQYPVLEDLLLTACIV